MIKQFLGGKTKRKSTYAYEITRRTWPAGFGYLLFQFCQITLGVDRCRASHSGRRYRLAIDMIGAIPRDKYARDIGFHSARWNDVTVCVHVDGPPEKLRVGNMTD